MKIDFHTHTKLGKKLPFSQIYTDGILRDAKKAGLDAICLTEHYNGIDILHSFEYITNIMERRGDCFVSVNHDNGTFGLAVFLGLEVDAAEGGHFLVIGSLETMQAIYYELGVYLQAKEHPPFEKLLDIVNTHSVLFGVSHPFRDDSKNRMPNLPEEQLKQLDFIDLNGKDTAYDRTSTEAKVKALSKRLGVPYLAGSDTHQSFQIGCIYNQFEKLLTTIAELREAIENGAYSIVYGDSALMQVTAANIIKRTLKAIHELGGDYVSVLFENDK